VPASARSLVGSRPLDGSTFRPRRAQCINDLKQRALAAANDSDTVGCLPMGADFGSLLTTDEFGAIPGSGVFQSLLPQLEQATDRRPGRMSRRRP